MHGTITPVILRFDLHQNGSNLFGNAPASDIVSICVNTDRAKMQVFEGRLSHQTTGGGSDSLACLSGAHPPSQACVVSFGLDLIN